ncbi:hypothetical protein HOLDEFILI_02894 [Holdemania filiformis DSM 12042]|uniref:Uncharacterized protein n=1 Tax=Holdemania filiformis DSM 12042 TaxID=545696 RepID=B9YAN7_9FIRM|nr:hypothetical protein HOLDEFILI_02894 [Holdemania filiformis DSM 12042]
MKRRLSAAAAFSHFLSGKSFSAAVSCVLWWDPGISLSKAGELRYH